MRSVRLVSRSRQRMVCPRVASRRTTAEPMNPLPPVTRTRTPDQRPGRMVSAMMFSASSRSARVWIAVMEARKRT
jgi:hypothetical protein